MKTQTIFKFFIAALLLLVGSNGAVAKNVIEAGSSGISFRMSNQDKAADIVSLSPDATSKAGTVEMLVNSNSRIFIPGVIMNVIEFKAAANGGQNVRFKLKNAGKSIYYLTVAPSNDNWLSTMTLQ